MGEPMTPMSMPPMPPPPPIPGPPRLEYQMGAAVKKEPFGIFAWGWVCFLAGVVVCIPMIYHRLPGVEVMSYMAGLAGGLLIVGLVPALIAFYVGKRSRMAATVTFVVVIAFGVLGQVGQATRFRQAQAANRAWAGVNSQLEQAKAEVANEVQDGDFDPEKMQARIASLADITDKASSGLGGEDAAVLRAISGFLKRLGDEVAPHAAATTELIAKSPFSPGWVKGRADFEQARASIRAFRKSNASCRLLLTRMETVLGEELAKQKAPPAAQASAAKAAAAKFSRAKPHFVEIRDTDAAMADEMEKVCDLLDENWGRWHFDEEAKTMIFEDDQTLARFNASFARLQRISAEQLEAQRQYLQALR